MLQIYKEIINKITKEKKVDKDELQWKNNCFVFFFYNKTNLKEKNSIEKIAIIITKKNNNNEVICWKQLNILTIVEEEKK